ncbi:MAG: MlaE family lipid ABC transporter permease subunit [Acaryochloridaceae cyanobacterium CSU_3_4]|nr:MlaE family lipid ABC transporter permease subunit [Acaryochloridaceae cyanobacterium CSU_3_4]
MSHSGFTIWSRRLLAAIFLGGQVVVHLLRGKIHRRNTLEQMAIVGPESLLVALLTATFVGMVFTIQVAREFITFGLIQAVGGVLALALTRELAPVLTAVIITGRVCSAFAAEIGTMRVTEQIDALQMLDTDPVDYLVVPRLLACALMLPILTLISLVAGVTGGMVVASVLYDIPYSVFLDSVQSFLDIWDIWNSMIKAVIFGGIIAIVGSSWGLTTAGGAKGVGQSTTAAVVTALLSVFMTNFFLSWLMFQGMGGTALQNL